MKNFNFKVGDYVRSINNHNYKECLTLGKSYIVVEICGLREDERVKIEDDNKIIRWYFSLRFELDIPARRNVIINEILL